MSTKGYGSGSDDERDIAERSPAQPVIRFYAILITAFLCLLGLKFAQVLDWSWWWITLPLWLGPLIHLLIRRLPT